ncbi:MAG: hypothetical protein IT428_08920 [Planctomycetaceae bacterium]|nr:hypothetical protein [Planctomycetaceae bacterium]
MTTLDVKGKQAHDARLVAAMTRFSIPHLLTHNYRDFLRYLSITAHSPADVLNGSFPVEESL